MWTAILVALGWSYGAIAFRALTGRRTSGLLLLTALLITARTALALLTDSTFVYFLQPIVSDGVVATAFLLSLVTARPMVARLAGDFYPMDHELAMRPRVRRLFRHLTVLWALLGLGKAMLTLWLLQSTDARDVRAGQERHGAGGQPDRGRGDDRPGRLGGAPGGAAGPAGGTLTRWASGRTRSASASACSP